MMTYKRVNYITAAITHAFMELCHLHQLTDRCKRDIYKLLKTGYDPEDLLPYNEIENRKREDPLSIVCGRR